MTAYTGQTRDDAEPIVRRPMGLPITAAWDSAWIQTRVPVVQCLRPLRHSGAPSSLPGVQSITTGTWHYVVI